MFTVTPIFRLHQWPLRHRRCARFAVSLSQRDLGYRLPQGRRIFRQSTTTRGRNALHPRYLYAEFRTSGRIIRIECWFHIESKLLRVAIAWWTPTAWQSRINDLEPDSLPSFHRAFFIPLVSRSLCLPLFPLESLSVIEKGRRERDARNHSISPLH